jgi:ribosomal protein L37E
MVLSPIDKINLARAHKFGHWLEEGVTSLVDGDQRLTREELAMLGWETAALILWIKDRSTLLLRNSNTLSFRKDSIKCGFCVSSASLLSGSHDCYHCASVLLGDEVLKCASITPSSGTADTVVPIKTIMCNKCGGRAFYSTSFICSSCSFTTYSNSHGHTVRITPKKSSKEMIKEVFGEEIEELSMSVA